MVVVDMLVAVDMLVVATAVVVVVVVVVVATVVVVVDAEASVEWNESHRTAVIPLDRKILKHFCFYVSYDYSFRAHGSLRLQDDIEKK